MATDGPNMPGDTSATPHQRPELALPAELAAALRTAPEARARFDALAPSHRREYVRWVTDARRADARERRAAQTIMRLLELH